ncbi:hypothetical protein HYT51_02645 [Candidatus Woesearchaeota archaeon]|nr:hypothetical protein [Candidatus Woesearchaeota archaeon]
MRLSTLLSGVLLAGGLITNSVNAEENKRQDEVHLSYLRNTDVRQMNVDIQMHFHPLPLDFLVGGSYSKVQGKKDMLMHLGIAKSFRYSLLRIVPYTNLEMGYVVNSEEMREEGWMNQDNLSLGTILDCGISDLVRLGLMAKHVNYINAYGTPSEDVLGINVNFKCD